MFIAKKFLYPDFFVQQAASKNHQENIIRNDNQDYLQPNQVTKKTFFLEVIVG